MRVTSLQIFLEGEGDNPVQKRRILVSLGELFSIEFKSFSMDLNGDFGLGRLRIFLSGKRGG